MNRTKARYLIVFVLLCSVPFLTFGDESATETDGTEETAEAEKPKHPYLTDEFQFTFNAGVGVSQFQWYFSGGFQFDFRANPILGVGFKSTVDYGFKYGNVHINLFALFDVWWFYIGPGVNFRVRGMSVPSNDPDYAVAYPYDAVASLAVTAGFRFPIARIGPGNMTIDLSVDWYQTDIPLSQPAPPFTGATINELLNSTVYAFKFAARLGYTF